MEQINEKGSPPAAFSGETNAGLSGGRRLAAHRTVFLIELLNATGGVDHLLLAGVEGVAGRADFNVQCFLHRRVGGEGIATGASDLNFFVIWMDVRFHRAYFLKVNEPAIVTDSIKQLIILDSFEFCNRGETFTFSDASSRRTHRYFSWP